MRTLAPSASLADDLDPVSRVVLEFEEAWRSGPPPLERFRTRLGDDAPYGLAELVKADLQNRYRRGERPAAREYLDRFPELATEGGRALSLIYEEYCLRVEAKEAVDASEFCRDYPTWRDSLVSQLAYHRDLSRAVEPPPAEDDAPGFPAPGDRFGEYDLIQFLGEGASAHVYLAGLASLGGKQFALKVSRDRGLEPEILGKLDHPNIIPVISSVVDPATGLRGLVMPYRPGLPIDKLIRRLRREGLPRRARILRAMVDSVPDPEDKEGARPGWSDFPDAAPYADAVAWIGLKAARALAHAHFRGFFHRDVKPENILLNGRDGPQLIDFNLAHDPHSADAARSAQRGGTLPYMAREHLEAFRDPTLWPRVGGRADLFSLGLVLRELLTLQPPARPADGLPLPRAINAMIQAREAPRPPIRRANPRVPHALEAIVAKCLAASPDDRYASAAALAEDLALYLARRPLLHATNPSRGEAALNALRRHRVAIAGAGALLAIAVTTRMWLTAPPSPLQNTQSRETTEVLEGAAADEAAGRHGAAYEKIGVAIKHGDAVRSFEEATRRHPGSLALLIGLAGAYEETNLLGDAARTYRDVLARDAGRVAALAGLANVQVRRGRDAEAVGLLDQCIALAEKAGPGIIRSWLPTYRLIRGRELISLGDAAYDRENFDEARSHFGKALDDLKKLDPHPLRKDGSSDIDLEAFRERHIAVSLHGLGRAEPGPGPPGHGRRGPERGPRPRADGPQAQRGARPPGRGLDRKIVAPSPGRGRARRGRPRPLTGPRAPTQARHGASPHDLASRDEAGRVRISTNR